MPSHKDVVSTNDLFWIMDQMALNKIRKLALCGGEPFLFNGLMEVVAYASTKNIQCYITSNGMTIHKLQENDLQLLKSNNSEINISMDSFDENILSKTRGTSKALSNVLMSIDVLQNRGIPFTILSVITKHNFRELFDFIKKAHQKEIRQVLFQPVISYSNFPERAALENKPSINVEMNDLPLLEDQLFKIKDFEKSRSISTNVYRIIPWIGHYIRKANGRNGKWFFQEVVNTFFCRDIHTMIDISYEGIIQPCGLRKGQIDIFENREKGLLALWEEATKEIKENMKHHRYYPQCNGCCHHFSRNMYASILKFPLKNFKALFTVTPFLISRMWAKTFLKPKQT